MDISRLLNPVPICGSSKEKAGPLDTPPAAETQTQYVSVSASAAPSHDAQVVGFDEATDHWEYDTHRISPVHGIITYPLPAYNFSLFYPRRAVRGRDLSNATVDEVNHDSEYSLSLVNDSGRESFVRRDSEFEIFGDGLPVRSVGFNDAQEHGRFRIPGLRTINAHEASEETPAIWWHQWHYCPTSQRYGEIEETMLRCERYYHDDHIYGMFIPAPKSVCFFIPYAPFFKGYHNLYANDSDLIHHPDIHTHFESLAHITPAKYGDLTYIFPTAQRDFDTVHWHGMMDGTRVEIKDIYTLETEEIASHSPATTKGRSVSPPSENESCSSRPSIGKRSYEYDDEAGYRSAKRAKIYAHTPYHLPSHSSSSSGSGI